MGKDRRGSRWRDVFLALACYLRHHATLDAGCSGGMRHYRHKAYADAYRYARGLAAELGERLPDIGD